MNNMPEMKVGIVAVSRDCFPESLSVNRRENLVNAYTQKYGKDISVLYWRMVRSEEKKPAIAVFISIFLPHAALSLQSASACSFTFIYSLKSNSVMNQSLLIISWCRRAKFSSSPYCFNSSETIKSTHFFYHFILFIKVLCTVIGIFVMRDDFVTGCTKGIDIVFADKLCNLDICTVKCSECQCTV